MHIMKPAHACCGGLWGSLQYLRTSLTEKQLVEYVDITTRWKSHHISMTSRAALASTQEK